VIALTKTMDLADYGYLNLNPVMEHFNKEAQQAEQRAWEYGMALHAASRWSVERGVVVGRALDVGGAGSPLFHMFEAMGWDTTVVDPQLNWPLHEYRDRSYLLVTCISVLEHIPLPELPQFWDDLAAVVAPGGLLFLTMDIQENIEPDTKHFHWMRTWLPSLAAWVGLAESEFPSRGFEKFGGFDYSWHGPQVYDYSFASLALVKR
jgi:hypothetical protein